jgi:hypothetical protein
MNVGGKSVSLGAPWNFSNYTPTSFLGRADAARKQSLAIAQRLNGVSTELALAKAGRRDPALPEVSVRAQMAKSDRAKLVALRKEFGELETAVFNMEVGLRPFDEDQSLSGAIVRAQLRDRLHSAKDDAQRTELLKIAEYRRAAYEAPPQTSNVSPLTYARLKQEDIARRHPEEVNTIKQFREAEQIVEATLAATETALGAELIATGVVAQEQPAPPPQAEETWT